MTSSTNPASSTNQTHTRAQTDAVKAETVNPPAENAADSNPPVPEAKGSSPLFLIVLLVLAILPISIGVGISFVNGSTSQAGNDDAMSDQQCLDGSDQSEEKRPLDRQIGDRLLRAREYESALEYYKSMGDKDPARLPPELLYRIAICQECLGLWTEARSSYLLVNEKSSDPDLRTAACLGQARIFLRAKNAYRAANLMQAALCHGVSLRNIPTELLHEFSFSFAMTNVQVAVHRLAVSRTPNTPLPVNADIDWTPESLLYPVEKKNSEELPTDASAAVNQTVLQILHSGHENRGSAKPEQWLVDILCNQQTVRSMLDRMAQQAGWTLDIDQLGNTRFLDRKVTIDVSNFPLFIVLTGLTNELQAAWKLEDGRLTLSPIDEDSRTSTSMLARSLMSAKYAAPGHRLVKYALFADAEMDQLQGRFADAASKFHSLTGLESSPFAIRAAYNAGLNSRQIGEFSQATRQFGFVVDAAPESEICPDATIAYGQLLLDTGDPQNAAFQFRRAAETSTRPLTRAKATALLGLALLVADKHYAAGEAIFALKDCFEEPSTYKNGAAFVTALARYKALTSERREREVEFLYRALVALRNDSAWMGPTGQVVIGRTLFELGFTEQMGEIYRELEKTLLPEYVKHEVQLTLALFEYDEGNVEKANQTLNELEKEPEDIWTNRARWKLAKIAFDSGELDECIRRCREVVGRSGIERNEVFQLMGRIYERRGDDEKAARAYAGQDPEPGSL